MTMMKPANAESLSPLGTMGSPMKHLLRNCGAACKASESSHLNKDIQGTRSYNVYRWNINYLSLHMFSQVHYVTPGSQGITHNILPELAHGLVCYSKMEAVPRFELGLLVSETRVMTTTLYRLAPDSRVYCCVPGSPGQSTIPGSTAI